MPIREYRTVNLKNCCDHCKAGFERLESMSAEPLSTCPRCGGVVERQFSAAQVGGSQSSFDQRAKEAGFSKLDKLSKGEYERKY